MEKGEISKESVCDDKEIIFSRHLNEVDDLEAFGRDAPICDSEENEARIERTSSMLADKVRNNNRRAVLFVTSPRLRAIQTAEEIERQLEKKLPEDFTIKFRLSVNNDLRASEQGTFILNEEYKPGEEFKGLKLAGKIFEKENKGDNDTQTKNIDYRFGDPVLLADGGYKYPELKDYFSEYGETYRETLTRMYRSILEMSKKYDKLLKDVEVVVVGHGQTYHIIRGLKIIGERIQCEGLVLEPGDTIQLLWNVYAECSAEEKVPGISTSVNFDMLGNHDLMRILEREIEYLSVTMGS